MPRPAPLACSWHNTSIAQAAGRNGCETSPENQGLDFMNNWKLLVVGSGLAFCLASGSAFAQEGPQKCGGGDIANGPFTYSTPSITETTFNGTGGAPISTSFTVTAPTVNGKNDPVQADVFPGEGKDQECSPTADATISALEISRVGDANGNPLDTPVKLDPFSGVGQIIAAAFLLVPANHVFGIGQTVTVNVEVGNPNLSGADYGDYDIKLAAKAPAFGIGVGDGPHFFLSLRAASATDTTKPAVSVTKPGADEILGVIGVEVTAFDPNGPVASGLASISASVSSAGGTVSNPVSLELDHSLPQAAGVVVTATGSFTPTGGAPGSPAGTTDAMAFTSGSRSGIGSYTISAQATDGVGNVGTGSKSFDVKYDVAFTDQSVPNGCRANNLNPCAGRFKFTVKRSNVTSDGAFMFDRTVVVKLVGSNNTVAATHVFGTGSINDIVQIDSTNLVYQTQFRHSELPGNPGLASYKLQVFFLDVDGHEMLQATSSSLSF